MIKCLLTELDRAGRENIWLLVMAYGPRSARSIRHDLKPNTFKLGSPIQSIMHNVSSIGNCDNRSTLRALTRSLQSESTSNTSQVKGVMTCVLLSFSSLPSLSISSVLNMLLHLRNCHDLQLKCNRTGCSQYLNIQ